MPTRQLVRSPQAEVTEPSVAQLHHVRLRSSRSRGSWSRSHAQEIIDSRWVGSLRAPWIGSCSEGAGAAFTAIGPRRISAGAPAIGGVQHPVVSAFRSTLSDPRIQGREHLVVEERWQPANKTEWLPEAIADLERAKVNVIFALGAIPARALKAAGTTIPSVFLMVIPTAEFVANTEKPEGSMPGFTIFDPKLPRQQLEILKQTVPIARRVAFIGDEAVGQGPFKPHEDAARALGLEPLVIKLRAPQPDLVGAFDEIQRERVEGLVALLPIRSLACTG